MMASSAVVRAVAPAAARPRVLFVDSEVAVLDGLRNVLHKDRRRWDMAFVSEAAAALELLAAGDLDVIVVSDVFGAMDAAELLVAARERSPGTARIALSAHPEQAFALRALSVAHKLLSKPCAAEVLRAAIERSLELARLLTGESLRRIVGGIDALPPMPRTTLAVAAVAERPDAKLADVAAVVGTDPLVSAKVLQVASSPFFGGGRAIGSLPQAVARLGVRVVKAVAFSAEAFGALGKRRLEGLSLERLQSDSLRVARLASKFIPDPVRGEEALTAALVHDLGMVVLSMGLGRAYKQIVDDAARERRPAHALERERLGVTHAEAGAYLLGAWGLPFGIVEAVAYHHDPAAVCDGPCETVAAVHVAAALVDREAIDVPFLESRGLAGRLPAWRAAARQLLDLADPKEPV